MKILHLSDLHIGEGGMAENTADLFACIIEYYKQDVEKPVISVCP